MPNSFDFDPNQAIPNGPFYSPETWNICTTNGYLIKGTGLCIDAQLGTIYALGGGGGGGTVTSITAGAGLTADGVPGGSITTTGTLALAASGVTAGSYQRANVTVDVSGRITSIASTTAVTSITAGTGLDGGTITSTGTIDLSNTGVTAGSYTFPTIAVDSQGRITTANSNTAVTSITAGSGLDGGTITSTGTIELPDTGVTPSSYTNPQITVDSKGRITSATSGTGGVSSVTATSPLVSSGGPAPDISLQASGVGAGGYTYANITVSSEGLITSASSGTAPVTAVNANVPLTSSGGVTPSISLLPSGVTAGTYSNPTINVDGFGRITSATGGAAAVSSVAVTSPATLSGTASDPIIGVRLASTGQTGAVQAGTNINITPLGVISVDSASTSQPGIVQLNDTTASTSTTEALTANQGKLLQDQINGLLVSGTIELAGTIDASSGLVESVTSVGTADGYTTGAVLPAATALTNNTYVIVTTPGTFTPPGGVATTATRGDWLLVSETSPTVYAWTYLNVGFDAPYASTTIPGLVCLATTATAQAGVDTLTALTPATGAATYVPQAALTAKGALLSASAACTVATLPVGNDGDYLVADSGTTSGLNWCALALDYVPDASFTAAGDLLAGTGAGTYTALGVGTTNQFLVADSGCIGGMTWCTPNYLAPSLFTAKGSLLSSTNPGVVTEFLLGSDDDVLTVCSLSPTGLCWKPASIPAIPCSCITVKGAVLTGTGPAAPIALPPGNDGDILYACSAEATGLRWLPGPAPSIPRNCITGKGALVTGSAFNSPVGLAVGADGQILVPNSSCTVGLQWINNPAILCSALTSKGSLISASAAGTPAELTPGADCLYLQTCAACPTGLTWTTVVATAPEATPTVLGSVYGRMCCGSGGIGFKALNSLTTGLYNVGVGECAAYSVTSANGNVAIGGCALFATTGFNNVAIGLQAMACNISGINSVAVGNQAGFKAISSGNVFIGAVAGQCTTTGFRETLVGEQSGANVTTGDCNTGVGWGALINTTSGVANVALGVSAGNNITTGSANVAIGQNVTVPVATSSNQLAIGYNTNSCWLTGDGNKNLCTYGNFIMNIGGNSITLASGCVGFVNESNNGQVLVMGSTQGNTKVYQRFCVGTSQVGFICGVVNGIFYSTGPSDYRLKENVTPVAGASDSLRALPIYEYNFIEHPEHRFTGFMAHELAEVVPDAVSGTKDEVDEDGKPVYQNVDYSRVVPLLAAALKESIERIDALEKKVADLEGK